MAGNKLSFINYSHSYKLPGFPPVPALSNVSISGIEKGEIVCIVGPNGSGKSTLFSAIIGLLDRDGETGHICLDDSILAQEKLNISYIPQKPSEGYVSDLSVIENIVLRSVSSLWPKFHRAISGDVRDNIDRLLSGLGFDFLISKIDMPPSSLSGGQQQVLNAVSSLYANADLIVSDEPTSKLDEQNKIRVCQLLVLAAHRNKSRIVLTTHDMAMAQAIADRIIYLEYGKVVREERLRTPMSHRSVGVVRFIATLSELKKRGLHCDNDWWKPNIGNIFGSSYFQGDDSVEGYLADRSLTREQRTEREVNAIIRIASLNKEDHPNIADIPCGWGRHSLELARRGYNVTGVDFSNEYIGKANISALKEGLSTVQFQCMDMQTLSLPDASFDLIINMWTSFGFFGQDGDEKVLLAFNRVLNEGGKLLVHTDLNPLRVRLGIFDEPSKRNLQNGGTMTVEEWFCEEDHFVYGCWTVHNTGSVTKYRIRVYSLDEWHQLALRCGFEVVDVFGSLDDQNRKLTDKSQELILLLCKKANFYKYPDHLII